MNQFGGGYQGSFSMLLVSMKIMKTTTTTKTVIMVVLLLQWVIESAVEMELQFQGRVTSIFVE